MTVLLPRLPVSAVAMVTLVTDVTMAVLLPRLPLSAVAMVTLGTDVTMPAVTKDTSVSVVAVVTCYHGYKAYPVRTCPVCSQSTRPDRRLRTVTVLQDTVCNEQRRYVALTTPIHHTMLLNVLIKKGKVIPLQARCGPEGG